MIRIDHAAAVDPMNDTSPRTDPWKIGFLILAIAVVLWVGYGVVVPRLFRDWEKSSQFGQMFGGIGALFSGLALAGVVVAVLMQQEELKRSVEAHRTTTQALNSQIALMSITARLNAHATLYHHHSDTWLRDQTIRDRLLSEHDTTNAPTIIWSRMREANTKTLQAITRIETLITQLERGELHTAQVVPDATTEG